MDNKQNDIDYKELSGYVTVTVEAENEWDTCYEFIFIAYVDSTVNFHSKKFYLDNAATHLTWLRGLMNGRIKKIEKSNLTEVIK